MPTPDVGGMTSQSSTPFFREFAEVWYQEKEVEWRRSYKETIRATLDKTLLPEFGDKPVGQISKAEVLAFRAKLGKAIARGKQSTLSTARINKILNPFRQILNEAADRFDFRTPFDHIKQLKVKRTDVEPFSLDEVKSILETVRADFRNYFTVRFFTGMRTGEIDGLKWKFVDFERRLILVRETIVGGEEEYTKTDGSQRDIQMSQLVYDALKAQRRALSKNAGGSRFFQPRMGSFMWARRPWQQILARGPASLHAKESRKVEPDLCNGPLGDSSHLLLDTRDVDLHGLDRSRVVG